MINSKNKSTFKIKRRQKRKNVTQKILYDVTQLAFVTYGFPSVTRFRVRNLYRTKKNYYEKTIFEAETLILKDVSKTLTFSTI